MFFQNSFSRNYNYYIDLHMSMCLLLPRCPRNIVETISELLLQKSKPFFVSGLYSLDRKISSHYHFSSVRIIWIRWDVKLTGKKNLKRGLEEKPKSSPLQVFLIKKKVNSTIFNRHNLCAL